MQRIIQSQTHSKTQDMQRDYYLNQKKTLEVSATYRILDPVGTGTFWLGQQCYGSMTFWYGSGLGSLDPYLCLMDADPGGPITYGSYGFGSGTLIIRYRSHKTVEIKVFLTIFAGWLS
jgi:hypothetical protein